MTLEALQSALHQRTFGLFPLSVVNGSQSDVLLERALALEYRVHNKLGCSILNGIDSQNSVDDEISSLVDEAATATLSETKGGSVENQIFRANYATLLLRTGKYQNVVDLFDSEAPDVEVASDGFTQALSYKKWYLLSLAYKALGDATNQKVVILRGLNSSGKIPQLSNVESNYWLRQIFDELISITPSFSVIELASVFIKNQNLIILFTEYLYIEKRIQFTKEFITDLQTFVTERAGRLLKAAKFPRAEQLNDYNLEEFLQQVTASSFFSPELKRNLIEDGIAKTYQSQILINSLTEILLQIGISDEIKASFEVFESYVESYYVLNGHSYEDILYILSLFQKVLDHKFGSNEQKNLALSDTDYHYYLDLIKKFGNLLGGFYTNNQLTTVSDEDDLFEIWAHNSDSRLSAPLKKLLGSYWASLGNATFKIHSSDHSIYSENQTSLANSLNCFKNSVFLNQNEEVFFQYALNLSILRRTKESFKLLKYFLKSLKLKNETYFKSWHLLSLILSIEENKEESFKVTSFIINEIDEFLTESVNLSLLSPILKQIFIQVKITQLAIIESLFGIEQTLANLPEVFDLFNKLFQDSLDSTQQLDESFKEHKKSKSSTSSKLTKIKSIKPHKKQTQDIKTPSSTTTSSPYQFKSNHITEPKILQKLWILSSVIYAKAGLTTEAEQSLIDAEKSYHPTTELHATLAQLKSLSDPNAALQEYEKALTLDRKSLNVIVGFSNLLLNTDNKKLIFIDEKDTLAGLARVKLLLETVAETFEGSFNSEVWWLLSLIYEKFKDKKRLKESLWRSVELEETRGVRSFDSVEAWV